MTIKAVLRHGVIQPIEPLPPDWADGQELVVEEPNLTTAPTPRSASGRRRWTLPPPKYPPRNTSVF